MARQPQRGFGWAAQTLRRVVGLVREERDDPHSQHRALVADATLGLFRDAFVQSLGRGQDFLRRLVDEPTRAEVNPTFGYAHARTLTDIDGYLADGANADPRPTDALVYGLASLTRSDAKKLDTLMEREGLKHLEDAVKACRAEQARSSITTENGITRLLEAYDLEALANAQAQHQAAPAASAAMEMKGAFGVDIDANSATTYTSMQSAVLAWDKSLEGSGAEQDPIVLANMRNELGRYLDRAEDGATFLNPDSPEQSAYLLEQAAGVFEHGNDETQLAQMVKENQVALEQNAPAYTSVLRRASAVLQDGAPNRPEAVEIASGIARAIAKSGDPALKAAFTEMAAKDPQLAALQTEVGLHAKGEIATEASITLSFRGGQYADAVGSVLGRETSSNANAAFLAGQDTLSNWITEASRELCGSENGNSGGLARTELAHLNDALKYGGNDPRAQLLVEGFARMSEGAQRNYETFMKQGGAEDYPRLAAAVEGRRAELEAAERQIGATGGQAQPASAHMIGIIRQSGDAQSGLHGAMLDAEAVAAVGRDDSPRQAEAVA